MITITTPPGAKAIELSLVKEHLRVIGTDDDTLLNFYIDAATEVLQSYANIYLINQTVKQVFDAFPAEDYFLLEAKPANSITSIKYYDTSNVLQTFLSSNYHLLGGESPKVCLASGSTWPSDIHSTKHGAVEVILSVGYGAGSSSVPADIRIALSLLVGEFFEKREDSNSMPGASTAPSLWHSKLLMRKFKPYFFEHLSQQRVF